MFTSQSLALLLLIAHSSLASPIVPAIVVKSLINVTGPPPKGPNRYAALGAFDLDLATSSNLESRELHDYFAEEELVARGMTLGEPLVQVDNPSSPVEEPKETPASLSSALPETVFAQPSNLEIKQLLNPKNTAVRRPRPRPTVSVAPSQPTVVTPNAPPPPPPAPVGCFPSSRTSIPTSPAAAASLKSWWCDESTEYGFLGFSYALYSCPSQSQMTSDFTRMKKEFGARYVRIYAYCDESWTNDALVEAASSAGLGIYGLIWFGWEDPNIWKKRRDLLIKTIKTNPKAPYVYRNIAVGSEPLYDWALDPNELANQVYGVRASLAQFGIQTTISEMPYGYQIHNGAQQVLDSLDFVETNILPFFDDKATNGGNAWGMVTWSLDFFRQRAPGKRIVMTQTGWPSNANVWKANNNYAVAAVWSEKAYFDLLDSKCSYFKQQNIAWFAQIWSDSQLDGWGILDWNGKPKFNFSPRTSC